MIKNQVTIIVLSALLTGCPVNMWTVKPDIDISGPLKEGCIRDLQKREDVFGVVKMDWSNYQPEFNRYFVETTSGVVHLDIKYPESKNQKISLFYSEAGDDISDENREKAKSVLNSLANYLETSCK